MKNRTQNARLTLQLASFFGFPMANGTQIRINYDLVDATVIEPN